MIGFVAQIALNISQLCGVLVLQKVPRAMESVPPLLWILAMSSADRRWLSGLIQPTIASERRWRTWIGEAMIVGGEIRSDLMEKMVMPRDVS